jgi:protein-L-isoaspartate(D-aspartate) O-methyltransferase
VSARSREDLPSDRRRRARMAERFLGAEADPSVRAAMAELPRHWFVPADIGSRAYDDAALPIGDGQTISQPEVVARMLGALALRPGARALDVGAGSGYAAALIARLVAPADVRALERQPHLAAQAAALLAEVAPSVRIQLADGLAGLPGEAPFDAIHVACACAELPGALAELLAPMGRMVVPVGPRHGWQRLLLVRREEDGGLSEADLGEVVFVPALPGLAEDAG